MDELPKKPELQQAILDTLRERDALKKEILEELKGKKQEEPPKESKLVQQMLMLVLGFILTGVLGSWFSTYWHNEEWKQQQSLLARRSALDKKYEVANEVSKAIGDINSASLNVLSIIFVDDVKRRAAELPAERKRWEAMKQNWTGNSEVLLHKINVYFGRPAGAGEDAKAGKEVKGGKDAKPAGEEDRPAGEIFDDVINKRKQSNVELSNILELLEKARWERSPELKARAEKVVLSLNQEQKRLSRALTGKLAEDILRDASAPQPKGEWPWPFD
ncbi:MAG TPA: hypothetical protein VF668_10560 [Pyrinomonadaceae bacterium]|jgi:hypothetical protein